MVESTFSKYVESGSKVNKFKSFFDSMESLGKGVGSVLSKITSAIKAVQSGNLGIDKLVKSKLDLKQLGLSGMLTSKMKEMGFSDEATKLVSSKTDSFMDTMNEGVFSLYKTAEAFSCSLGQSLYNSILGSVYVPEDAFLNMVKALVKTGGDPNYNSNYLRKICIQQDLVKTLEWLDGYNNINYTIGEIRARDATSASRYGAYHVALYILDELVKDYKEILTLATATKDDIDKKNALIKQHTSYFHSIVKNIIVYSYANLSENDVKHMVDKYNIKPREFGTTGKDYGKKHLIGASDINVLAPFYRNKNRKDDNKYINPRNNNIKKIYIILSSEKIYGKDNMMYNKEMYTRLKYPIISTLQKALDAAGKAFNNSALGKFLDNAENDIHATIYNLTKKMKDLLFNPKKQTYLSTKDCMVLPEPVDPTTTTSKAITIDEKNAANQLPQPAALNGKTIIYENYYTYLKNTTEDDQIIKAIFDINKSGNYSDYKEYVVTKTIIDQSTLQVTKTAEDYFVFYNNSSGFYSSDELATIIKYILTKYIVDQNKDKSLNDIALLYQDLPVGDFSNYLEMLKSTKLETQKEINEEADGNGGLMYKGNYTNYTSLTFFTSVILSNDYKYIIDSNNLYKYDSNGTLIKTVPNTEIQTNGSLLGINVDTRGFICIKTTTGISVSTDGGFTFAQDTNVHLDAIKVYITAGYETSAVSDGNGGLSVYGIWKNYTSFIFYSKLLLADNSYLKIEGTTVVKYNKSNSKLYTITQTNGIGAGTIRGIAFDKYDDIYILTDNGVAFSSDGITFFNNNKFVSINMKTIDGVGYSSISQLVFYKVFYLKSNNTFYQATVDGIKYTGDNGSSYKWYNITNGLSSNNCIGVCLTEDGYIYVLTPDGVFGVLLSKIVTGSKFTKFAPYYDNTYTVQITGIGTINTSVDIPYFSLDDIDIDDDTTRNMIETNVMRRQENFWVLSNNL